MATLTDMAMDMDMARGRLPPVIIIMVMDMVDMAMDTDMERGRLRLPLATIIMVMVMDMDMDMDMERGRLRLPLAIISWLRIWWIWSWIWIWKEGSHPRLLSSWLWWIWSWIWLWIPWLSSIYLLVSQNFVAFIGICWNLLSRNTDLYLKRIKIHSLK